VIRIAFFIIFAISNKQNMKKIRTRYLELVERVEKLQNDMQMLISEIFSSDLDLLNQIFKDYVLDENNSINRVVSSTVIEIQENDDFTFKMDIEELDLAQQNNIISYFITASM
jgi:hypothetical protein